MVIWHCIIGQSCLQVYLRFVLQLLSVSQRFLQCRITSGTHIGAVEMFIPCVFSITPESSGLPFAIERRQYPIIPAFCLSVHKAQGQSLEFVGLVFETDPFAHGQLYVALSRAGSWGSIRVVMRSTVATLKNLVFKHLIMRDV